MFPSSVEVPEYLSHGVNCLLFSRGECFPNDAAGVSRAAVNANQFTCVNSKTPGSNQVLTDVADEVSTGSDSDRVAIRGNLVSCINLTRSLPLSVPTPLPKSDRRRLPRTRVANQSRLGIYDFESQRTYPNQ